MLQNFFYHKQLFLKTVNNSKSMLRNILKTIHLRICPAQKPKYHNLAWNLHLHGKGMKTNTKIPSSQTKMSASLTKQSRPPIPRIFLGSCTSRDIFCTWWMDCGNLHHSWKYYRSHHDHDWIYLFYTIIEHTYVQRELETRSEIPV